MRDDVLTTITPYWGRPEMLEVWFEAMKGATVQGLKHIIYFIGEPVPDWMAKELQYNPAFILISFPDLKPGDLSIGYFHNQGAKAACTEWMMKMDIDTLPNVRYFKELLVVLSLAKPAQWFNGGMVYVSQGVSNDLLAKGKMPLSEETYKLIMSDLRRYCGNHNTGPAATNFICRTKIYLEQGGCHEGFRGYGWEDYQQIFMLEKQFLGSNPLPGCVNLDNVTRRCCREISRRRARELYHTNPWLCLLHRFHHSSPDRSYKSPEVMGRNKKILLDYIKARI